MSRRYVVVTCVRNTYDKLNACLASLAAQEYDHFTVVVVDDASTDGSSDLAEEWCDRYGWHFIGRTERMGAVRNQWDAIHLGCDSPDDVVVWVDGDDRLARTDTFDILNRHYDAGALVTWGSYEPQPPSATCPPSRPYPPKIVRRNGYRQYARPRSEGGMGGGICHNHLRSMAYGIVHQMDESDMKDDDGNWWMNTPDALFMFPGLELARGAVAFVPDVLLWYSSDMAHAEWRAMPRDVDKVNQWVMAQPPKVTR